MTSTPVQERLSPVTLSTRGVRLEPLCLAHEDGLAGVVKDGALWTLRVTSAPRPEDARAYIESALDMTEAGTRLPFAVCDDTTGEVLGTTSYHDILPDAQRLEIGYTFYAARWCRTHVNTVSKWLLLNHAFETLGWRTVGWRTDIFNFVSQRAIERLGARRDGVLRGNMRRRDGTIRDTVLYSVSAGDWPAMKAHIADLIERGSHRAE